ncbi:MAG TPA: hypothetical protein VK166_04930, partial [Chitinophagaceae bacterium]|nr:hypothetical protein [Chitinophagaceae bacterium]
PPKPSTSEMQQMTAELKKELAQLEDELKKTEDPEEAEMLKKQIAALKSMLGVVSKPMAPAKTALPPKGVQFQEYSPIVPVVLKVPVVAPAAGQDKDRYFWYKGKKVNDSTLVTRRGMVVQYSKKKQMLILKPEEKKDSLFGGIGREVARNEQRKNELVTKVSQMKNGFTYYPDLVGAIARYDDIAIRYGAAVKNTISFDKGSGSAFTMTTEEEVFARRGPSRDTADDWATRIKAALDDAKRKIDQLPPITEFPQPPRQELGVCAACDTNIINRHRKLTEQWEEAYMGKERAITGQIFSALREYQLLGGAEKDELGFNEKGMGMVLGLLDRMGKKNDILIQRVGKDLHYALTIAPYILGHERQLQLLGAGEYGGGRGMEFVVEMMETYMKYYDEQVAAKNHDFVLDLSFHLGVERQKQLLGAVTNDAWNIFEAHLNYNRFSLMMDMDFIVEEGNPADFDTRYTGNMAMKEKRYVMLVRDSCRYRMYSYTQDIENTKNKDILLEFVVNGGQKTYTEDGKKKTVGYSGPPSWFLRFPDTRIHFCADGIPDTLHLTNFFPDQDHPESLPYETKVEQYKISFVNMANVTIIGYEKDEANGDKLMDKGTNTLDAVTRAFSKQDPGNTLGRMKMQHESWIDITNNSVEMIRTLNTDKADILFQAANRSSVITEKYNDTKRSTDVWNIKRGMMHFRIAHEPISK